MFHHKFVCMHVCVCVRARARVCVCMCVCVCVRDVNLPLFGGIPLFFFTFRFFENDFPRFLKNRNNNRKKFFFSFANTATIDCSKSFGKHIGDVLVCRYALLPFPVEVPYLHSAFEI